MGPAKEILALLCCLIFVWVSGASASPAVIKGENADAEVIWFPDPSAAEEEEKYIPAYLNRSGVGPPADISKIHFYLYTRENPNNPDELFIGDVDGYRRSHFQPGAKLKFLSHGFGGDVHDTFPWATKNQFLTFNPAVERNNLILVGWPELAASPDYISAAANAKVVAQVTAEFVNFILQQGDTALADVHLIGYSLGGQMVGIAGNRFQQLTGLVIPRVTGLDPAKPLFEEVDDADRITADDADFVDIIHTSAGLLGIINARGTVDFYPNGGTKQPGCGVDAVGSCAHSRAPAMFKESLGSSIPFRSCECENWDQYNGDTCPCSTTANLGYWIDKSAKGKFYLRTNSEAPFAMG